MNFKSQTKLQSFSLRRTNFVFFLIFCFLLSPAVVKAQEDIVRVNTELAAFEVTVVDKDGNPVRGLEAKDFKIFENGVERNADFFEPLKKSDEGRPLAVVFALDVSGSMTTEELLRLRAALEICVKRLADYNSYFSIMTFGMQVKILQSFTNKPEKLEKTFVKILSDQDGLSTHAYDATDDAIRHLVKKAPSASKNKLMKRAVVLITDGFPVGDTVSPKTVIERANAAETSIYTVILPSYSRVQGGRKPLPTPLEVSGLIEKTGGRSFYANAKDFEPLFKSLAEEITSSYVLAFYPTEENRTDGKFHKVTIEAPQGLKIKQNRGGYQIGVR